MTDKDEYKEFELKLATGNRLKLFRQLLGLSRPEMAKTLAISPRQLQLFEDGRQKNFAVYQDLIGLYTQYGLNATFLFTGKGSLFTFHGPKTPETIYWVISFLFPMGLEIKRLNELIEILKNPDKKEKILAATMQARASLYKFLEPDQNAPLKQPTDDSQL